MNLSLKSQKIIKSSIMIATAIYILLFIILEKFYEQSFVTYRLTIILPITLIFYLLISFDTIKEMIEGFKNKNIFNENTLVIIASLGALTVGSLSNNKGEIDIGNYYEALVVMLLYSIGEAFEEYAENKCNKVINSTIGPKELNEYENKVNDVSSKAKPEKFITKFAKIYTPSIIILSFLVFIIGGSITKDFMTWLYQACALLVIACPCALVISIPLSYVLSLTRILKERNIAIKGGRHLDSLIKSKIIYIKDPSNYAFINNYYHICSSTSLITNNKYSIQLIEDGVTNPMTDIDVTKITINSINNEYLLNICDIIVPNFNEDNIKYLIQFSKVNRFVVFVNIISSISIKLVVMILALFNYSPLWLAIFADVGMLVLCILHSLTILKRTIKYK